jgi:hypothetical protein
LLKEKWLDIEDVDVDADNEMPPMPLWIPASQWALSEPEIRTFFNLHHHEYSYFNSPWQLTDIYGVRG